MTPITEKSWTEIWFWWLAAVAVSWLGLELASIVQAHLNGVRQVLDWTLSDTIRRWSAAHRWLAPIAVGTAAMLCWHFFAQQNPGG